METNVFYRLSNDDLVLSKKESYNRGISNTKKELYYGTLAFFLIDREATGSPWQENIHPRSSDQSNNQGLQGDLA